MKKLDLSKALSVRDREWLEATFTRNRARFGDLRMEGEGDAPGGEVAPTGDSTGAGEESGTGDTSDNGPKMGPNGYPLNTPWRQMEPAQQVQYWQHQSKSHEAAKKAALTEVGAYKPKAQQFDALDQASKTDQQREVDRLTAELQAATAAREAAKTTFGTQLVETKLESAAEKKGMTPSGLKTLAGDLRRFLGDDGMDSEAVETFLAALPDKATEQRSAGTRNVLGAGRQQSAAPSGLAAGAELFNQRHKKQTPA